RPRLHEWRWREPLRWAPGLRPWAPPRLRRGWAPLRWAPRRLRRRWRWARNRPGSNPGAQRRSPAAPKAPRRPGPKDRSPAQRARRGARGDRTVHQLLDLILLAVQNRPVERLLRRHVRGRVRGFRLLGAVRLVVRDEAGERVLAAIEDQVVRQLALLRVDLGV